MSTGPQKEEKNNSSVANYGNDPVSFLKYGMIGAVSYSGIYVGTLGVCYVLLENNIVSPDYLEIDVPAAIEQVKYFI
jgi:hypothetical protein